jgi:hypothetical protein
MHSHALGHLYELKVLIIAIEAKVERHRDTGVVADPLRSSPIQARDWGAAV